MTGKDVYNAGTVIFSQEEKFFISVNMILKGEVIGNIIVLTIVII